MFCRDANLPIMPLYDLISSFQAVTYKSDTMLAKPTASVHGLLSFTSHTSIAVKIKSEAFVVIVGNERVDLLTYDLGQKPWRKKEEPSSGSFSFVLHHGQSSDQFSLIHRVTLIKCSLNGYAADVRVDLGAPDA